MEQPPRRQSSYVHSADLLPPPPITKALMWGAGAAVLGAVAWGLLVVYVHREFGLLAWGIGIAVGFATIRAGGHGTTLAVFAALLALASIASGKQFAFRMIVDRQAAEMVQHLTAEMHESYARQAADWIALGASPTPQQIQQFAEQHDLEFTSAAEFARKNGEPRAIFAQRKPTLEQWREQWRAEFSDGRSFVDYLKGDIQPMNILFVLLGIASAFGLVQKATVAMRVAARQALRAEREGAAPAP
jgi:hypothetical protein